MWLSPDRHVTFTLSVPPLCETSRLQLATSRTIETIHTVTIDHSFGLQPCRRLESGYVTWWLWHKCPHRRKKSTRRAYCVRPGEELGDVAFGWKLKNKITVTVTVGHRLLLDARQIFWLTCWVATRVSSSTHALSSLIPFLVYACSRPCFHGKQRNHQSGSQQATQPSVRIPASNATICPDPGKQRHSGLQAKTEPITHVDHIEQRKAARANIYSYMMVSTCVG
jgi:hypothetical protein